MGKTLETKVRGERVALGQRLQAARQSTGLSQGQLSKLIDVPKNDLHRFESGAKVIPLALLPKLCEAMELRMSRLLKELNLNEGS